MRASSTGCPQNRQGTRARRPPAASRDTPDSISYEEARWRIKRRTFDLSRLGPPFLAGEWRLRAPPDSRKFFNS